MNRSHSCTGASAPARRRMVLDLVRQGDDLGVRFRRRPACERPGTGRPRSRRPPITATGMVIECGPHWFAELVRWAQTFLTAGRLRAFARAEGSGTVSEYELGRFFLSVWAVCLISMSVQKATLTKTSAVASTRGDQPSCTARTYDRVVESRYRRPVGF
jgi:hypothetical protein